jgi:hypothetical protein
VIGGAAGPVTTSSFCAFADRIGKIDDLLKLGNYRNIRCRDIAPTILHAFERFLASNGNENEVDRFIVGAAEDLGIEEVWEALIEQAAET